MLIRMDTQVLESPTDEQVAEAIDILKLVADSTRLRIMWALLHGEHSVNHLADHVGAHPSAVSQHLAKLRLGRLVRTRKEGTHVFYVARNDHVRRIVQEALFHANHVLKGLADHNVDEPGRRARSMKPA